MAAYIDVTYVDSFLGSSVRASLTEDAGANLGTLIAAATGIVQSALRNSGYQDTDTTTDETVKLATMGALWVMLAGRPAYNLALPENWKESPVRMAYVGILNGDVPVTHALNVRGAIGGFASTDAQPGSSTARVAYASRANLKGW